MNRRTVLGLLAVAPLACRSGLPDPEPRPDPVERAVAALRARALPDGRIPSTTYGFMRDGHSTTALLALALPDGPLKDGALTWLEAQLQRGPLGFAGPALDYPVYATAIGLRALLLARPTAAVEPAVDWLLAQQLSDGWEDAPVHGGFGMGRAPGQAPPAPPFPGHVDLSMTRRAMQALTQAAAAGLGGDRIPAALTAGAAFTRRCRAGDGGFVYSPGELALNKSALVPGVEAARSAADHRGYGSATADGLLALRAAGQEDEAALAWLSSHHRVDRNPGLEGAPIAAYATAMRFYYRAAAAEALAGTDGLTEDWRAPLRAAVLAEQGADGLWRNELALQKEDDPVIATGLALLALRA